MLRLLIAGVMLLIVGGANAATNEAIYQACKKYVDNNFESTELSHLNCVFYFAAVRDTLSEICEEYKLNFSALDKSEKAVFEHFSVSYDVSVKAAIQNYVNEMQKTPELWKYNAGQNVRKSLQKIETCKPE